MAAEANEDQIRDLVAKMQAYQGRMEALQQQANLIQASVNDVDAALKAITSLEGATEGHEMLVPIGAGSFVHATIAKPDKVLVGLGADISVERTVADARALFQTRRTELEKAMAEVNGVLNQVTGELMRLQQEAEKYRQ
ncbi:prefoldin subunit alpha [Methanocella sp. MCL-LM]|uniref:prefoldin subunit alpha n=1 Tax=Methanocella sp. MCL-LM TaxID=3412035 RepID=UPI003C746315